MKKMIFFAKGKQKDEKCSLCFVRQKPSEFYYLPCGHSFCRSCLNSYLSIQIDKITLSNGFLCPYCRQVIPNNDVKELLTPSNKKRLMDWEYRHSFRFKLKQVPKQYYYRFKTYIYLKIFTSPCPNCKAPTIRDGHRRHMICSCGYHWCWICGRTYHGHTMCRDTPKSRLLKTVLPFLFLLFLITLLYNFGVFLGYIGMREAIKNVIYTVFSTISSCCWFVVYFLYKKMELFIPSILIDPLKWIYTFLWRTCVIEGITLSMRVCYYLFNWIGSFCTWIICLTFINLWWVVSNILWVSYGIIWYAMVTIQRVVLFGVSVVQYLLQTYYY